MQVNFNSLAIKTNGAIKWQCMSILLAYLLMVFFCNNCWAAPPVDFTQAKKKVKELFQDQRETLYCGCKYDKLGKIDLKSCRMNAPSSNKRAHQIEMEHMMPMDTITKQFQCGKTQACVGQNGKRYGGRPCCRKISAEYRKIEGELYNLYPAVGSVNGARGSYHFDEFGADAKDQQYNHFGCPIIVNDKSRSVEPRNQAKGVVARANLFMADKYNIILSVEQKKLLETWNNKYPPSAQEITWAKKVAEIEGYENTFIMNHKQLSTVSS